MPNDTGSGGSGFPGPGNLPELGENPPAYIEGIGGGPAMPTGGGLSPGRKETADEISDTLNYQAAEFAGGAAAAGGIAAAGAGVGSLPVAVGGGIVGAILGIGSAIAWGLSQVFSDIAEDPPKPHEQIVTFQPRLCRPPGMTDPILSRLGIVAQRGVFTLVTARGLLDAMERSASAQQAGDLNWAITHYSVASHCYQTLVVDVATLASAMHAAAKALSGSEFDLPLKPGAGGVRKWIESPEMEAKMEKQMHKAGLLAAEIKAVIQWWKTDPKHSGPETTCSRLLLSSADKLYSCAQRLAL